MFITIDGIDGAGKTTLATGLAAWVFSRFGLNVLLTKEPTARSPWAQKLRSAALSDRLPKEKELEFFHKDRLWHLKHVIYPAIDRGQVVICDRYVDSLLAYQASDVAEADELFSKMSHEIAIPELTFILDCPVEVCFERISQRNQPITSFEKHDTLHRAKNIFSSRRGEHYRILNSTVPEVELLSLAKSELLPFLDSNEPTKRRTVAKAIDPKSSTFNFSIAAIA